MNDLINRQAAIDALAEEAEREPWNYSPHDAIATIKALPSAQPEIIRCRDCIKADLCAWRREGAEYCSYAERREDD